MVQFVLALADDADVLANLRVEAMRESLEAVGRFDPERARRRFLDGFDPNATWKIMLADKVVGFFVLKMFDDYLHLDHLYVEVSKQGQGLGGDVVNYVKSRASDQSLPVRLCALKDSKANEFYASNGFKVTRVEEFDTYFEYTPIDQPKRRSE